MANKDTGTPAFPGMPGMPGMPGGAFDFSALQGILNVRPAQERQKDTDRTSNTDHPSTAGPKHQANGGADIPGSCFQADDICSSEQYGRHDAKCKR